MSKHMMKKQKKWSRPQLIILGRGKPEERVLAACKMDGMGIQGPSSKNCARPVYCYEPQIS